MENAKNVDQKGCIVENESAKAIYIPGVHFVLSRAPSRCGPINLSHVRVLISRAKS
jgi:hypothetical protein